MLRKVLFSALFGVSTMVTFAVPAHASGVATAPPYKDPNAQGYIGLCNTFGQQVTSGSIYTDPFAYRSVSSVAGKAPYDNATRTATLLAFQPQQALPAGDWSGEAMTAGSRYSNPAHPMAAATVADDTLAAYLSDFPARWDGFVELRMYLSTVNAQPYTSRYPVLDVQVIGTHWYAVGGGKVNCRAGVSVSIESIVLPSKDIKRQKAPPTTTPTTTPTMVATTQGGSGSTTPTTAASAVSPTSSSGHGAGFFILALVALAAVAAGGYGIGRRRKGSTNSSPDQEQ